MAQNTYFGSIATDKARYAPDDTVYFEVSFKEALIQWELHITYSYLNQVIGSDIINGNEQSNFSWEWLPPKDDFRGYLVEVILIEQEAIIDKINITVDVSSNWFKFPRYGFLSKFPFLSQSQIEEVILNLNRFHINGLQFYDWHHKHHLPLKGAAENPDSTWLDIANRTIYFSTVQRYIETAHQFNMKAMAYNLLYGAYENAIIDGVPTQWRLFLDTNHSNPDFHDLPDNWASDIYLIVSSNPQWKKHIYEKMEDVFKA